VRIAVRAAWLLATPLCACGGGTGNVYSGTLQAPSASVGSTLGGRVTGVFVSEGDAVKTGQVVVRFDDSAERAALRSANARLAQTRAALADIEAGTRSADLARAQALAQQQRAQYEQARSTSPYQTTVLQDQLRQSLAQQADAAAAALQARLDAARMRSLFSTGDISAQTRDAAVAREGRANAQLSGAAAAARAARTQLANASAVILPENANAALAGYRAAVAQYQSLAAGPRPDQVRQAQATVRGAQGDVADELVRLDETVVRAPAAGVVTALNLHAGDLVAGGAPVATIDEGGNPFVRIYVPQSELGRVALGAHLSVRSDATSDTRFEGVVEAVDSQAQFTPQNVQTASDRAVLSFGVKVRVHDPRAELHGGTTVEVALP